MNRHLHSGDLMICGSILTSGNNFSKMQLWASQMNVKFPSSHSIQRTYLLPAVEETWRKNQQNVVEQFQDQELIFMGDGRNVSSGHCAQYCSHTLMEYSSKKIIQYRLLTKGKLTKSVNMEKLGLHQAMRDVSDKGLTVKEVVTDAHSGITCMMRNQFTDIEHSYDIWHVAENLGKKILKISQKKKNSVLQPWSGDIINHFWFSCQKANNSYEFLGIWRSVLHHVANQHEWIIPHGGLSHCLHEPLTEEGRNKPWLDPSEHKGAPLDLAEIVLDERLLNKVNDFLKCRSTAEL